MDPYVYTYKQTNPGFVIKVWKGTLISEKSVVEIVHVQRTNSKASETKFARAQNSSLLRDIRM